MGFRIDGCGTYTGDKKLKYVGDFRCDTCKAVYPFNVHELTDKVSVLYIPVGKISTRYAILCSHCKRGYKLDSTQKERVMNGDISFLFDDSEAETKKNEEKDASVPEPDEKSPVQLPEPDEENPSESCPRCGTAVDTNSTFCSKCGRKYNKVAKGSLPKAKVKICNNCAAEVASEMSFCTHCGNKFI